MDAIAFSQAQMGFITSVDATMLAVVSGQLQITALDLSLALGSSFDGATLQISGGKMMVNPATGAKGTGLDLGKAIAATVGTALAVSSGVLGVPAGAITQSLVANYAIGNTNLDRATANKIAIVDADVVNLAAAKITTGTLAAGVILSSSIAATQILAGTLAAGVIYAGSIGVGQLTAGTAAFAGTTTFGVGSNSVQISSSGVTIFGGSNSAQITSSAFTITSGSTSVTVSPSLVTVTGPSGSTQINGNAITCLSATMLQLQLNPSGSITQAGSYVINPSAQFVGSGGVNTSGAITTSSTLSAGSGGFTVGSLGTVTCPGLLVGSGGILVSAGFSDTSVHSGQRYGQTTTVVFGSPFTVGGVSYTQLAFWNGLFVLPA